VGEDARGRTSGRRVTLREAADILGISREAVRKRVLRGTLPSDTGEDGRRYVYLPASEDAVPDQGPPDPRDELIEHLRGEVEAWREESRRKDTIILSLTQRIPEIEAPAAESPTEAPGPPETATPQPGRTEPQTQVEGAQEGAERPWWRRMFGG
jgi:hypothetical protein